MDHWSEQQDLNPPPPRWVNKQRQDRYLGLTATQFNLAVFVVFGAIAAVVFLLLGGVSTVNDLIGGDESPRAAVTTRETSTREESAPEADAPVGESGGDDAVSAVLDTLNPFSLVGALSGQPGGSAPSEGGRAGDDLKAGLLSEGDLPAEFSSLGEMSFNLPTEGGGGTMVANIFASGDMAAGDLRAMVMSAAIEGPPGALGDVDEIGSLDEDEIAELEQALAQTGVTFSDLRLLDASGLGDGGMGMHVSMDFGAMFGSFGLPADQQPPFDSIVLEMYAFARGERMYMVMVMWPGNGDPGVDARSLADAVNAKTG